MVSEFCYFWSISTLNQINVLDVLKTITFLKSLRMSFSLKLYILIELLIHDFSVYNIFSILKTIDVNHQWWYFLSFRSHFILQTGRGYCRRLSESLSIWTFVPMVLLLYLHLHLSRDGKLFTSWWGRSWLDLGRISV